MRRTIIILCAICTFCTSIAGAQTLRRPPADNSIWCQMWPDTCTQGEFVRVKPEGPPLDSFAGGYSLPKGIAVTQVAHEDVPWRASALAKSSNLDFAWDAFRHGFDAIKLWVEEDPFNCGGPWHWHTLNGRPMTTGAGSECYDGPDECDGEDMMRFWREVPQRLLIVRPFWYAWSFESVNDDMILTHDDDADFYAIAKKLYEIIGDRDMVVVLTGWEQDHMYKYYPFQTLRILNHRQEGVKRARKEAYLELGHQPRLRVYHAAIVNSFVPTGAEPGSTLTEQIPLLEHRPDFIGVSYWKRGIDPMETINWITGVTHYPVNRIYIDEFGGDIEEQGERFGAYLPVFFDNGIDVVAAWLWKQGWCDPEHNRGLWAQAEPCMGTPVFTEPSPGYYELRRLRWTYR